MLESGMNGSNVAVSPYRRSNVWLFASANLVIKHSIHCQGLTRICSSCPLQVPGAGAQRSRHQRSACHAFLISDSRCWWRSAATLLPDEQVASSHSCVHTVTCGPDMLTMPDRFASMAP